MQKNTDASACLITQTVEWVNFQIEKAKKDVADLAEKVIIQETQITQTNSDIQEAFQKHSKQSEEECEYQLNQILNEPIIEFYNKSQKNLFEKSKSLKQKIESEKNQINIVEQNAEKAFIYLQKFDDLVQKKKEDLKNGYEIIFQNELNDYQNYVQSLKSSKKKDFILDYYNSLQNELKVKKEKVDQIERDTSLLKRSLRRIEQRIVSLSTSIQSTCEHMSIANKTKSLVKLEFASFLIIDCPPMTQKRQTQISNILVLAPIHSLTRKMHGSNDLSHLFTSKKNNFL